MTESTDSERQAFITEMQARLNRPMPLRVQRELALCTSIDELGTGLARTRAALEQARTALFQASPTEENASKEFIAWANSLSALGDAIEQSDRYGAATISAVRVLLQV